MSVKQYFVVYKPFGVLSQFSGLGEQPTLKSLGTFPKDVYPVGRLDKDSEGLLLLTNDRWLNHRLLNPAFGHRREYWAQVEGEISDAALKKLSAGGLEIRVKKKIHKTLPALAKRIAVPTSLPFRAVRFRKQIPTSWLSLVLTEGKNRQVRKMTAKVGFPTLRLVRVAIGNLFLENMGVGQVVSLPKAKIYSALKCAE